MPEENAIRVIEGQPEVAAIEIPHEAGLDPRKAPALVQEHEGPPDRRVQIVSGTPGSNRQPSPYGALLNFLRG